MADIYWVLIAAMVGFGLFQLLYTWSHNRRLDRQRIDAQIDKRIEDLGFTRDESRRATVRCPVCLSQEIKIPPIQAPKGHAFDSTLVLVTCTACGHRPKLSDATVIV